MDNPSGESNVLDVNQAAAVFSDVFADPEVKEPEKEPEQKEETEPQEEPQQEAEAEASEEPKTFTIKVDGKDVEVTEEQLAEAYKSGLRQEDYTRKTMETAEKRKAAEAERKEAAEQRAKYAQGLQQAEALLRAQLDDAQQIDWQALLNNDPVEYLKQQRIASERQAKLQGVLMERQKISQEHQAEEAKAREAYLQEQRDELLAKLPEWKDEAKATSEKTDIQKYLKDIGYTQEQIGNVTDAKSVVLARKAMLYDKIIANAKATEKRVAAVPSKVERPGVSEKTGLDKRSQAYQRLGKSGSIDDAAAVFSSLFN